MSKDEFVIINRKTGKIIGNYNDYFSCESAFCKMKKAHPKMDLQ